MIVSGYHGTFQDFKNFSNRDCGKYADLGAGIYITSEIDDAYENYGLKSSPDHAGKRAQLADELYNCDEFDSYQEAEEEAEEILGHNNRAQILKVGCILTENQIIGFDECRDIKSGDIEEIEEILSESYRYDELWGELEFLLSDHCFQFKEIHALVWNHMDEFENPAETLAEICLAIGIKCVRLDNADQRYGMDMPWETTHYCVFDPAYVRILSRQFVDEF